MLPSKTIDYSMNSTVAYLIKHSKLAWAHSARHFSNFYNFFLAKFRISIATSSVLPSLLHLIIHVISVRSKTQMGRINAIPFTDAIMKHKHSFWNFTEMQKIGIPMSRNIFKVYVELPIPLSIEASFPKPTRVCFLNTFPKSFINIGTQGNVITFHTTKFSFPIINMPLGSFKFCITDQTVTRYFHAINIIKQP